jgi:hypothetical protein
MTLSKLHQFIRAGERKHGRIPSPEILAGWSRVSVEEAKEAINCYTPEPVAAKEPTAETAVKDEAVPTIPIREILKISSLIVSGLCMVWSWGNIFTYFESSPWGAMISTVITSVLFVFPQTAKMSHCWGKALQYFLFVVAIGFAMLTTVNSNYNWRSASVTKSVMAGNASEDATGIKNQIKSLNDSIANNESERSTIQGKLPAYEVTSMEYNRAIIRIEKLKKEVESWRATVQGLSVRKEGLQDTAAATRDDLFIWIQKATGIKAESLEFFLGLIPAILADIAGPVALRVAMFL